MVAGREDGRARDDRPLGVVRADRPGRRDPLQAAARVHRLQPLVLDADAHVARRRDAAGTVDEIDHDAVRAPAHRALVAEHLGAVDDRRGLPDRRADLADRRRPLAAPAQRAVGDRHRRHRAALRAGVDRGAVAREVRRRRQGQRRLPERVAAVQVVGRQAPGRAEHREDAAGVDDHPVAALGDDRAPPQRRAGRGVEGLQRAVVEQHDEDSVAHAQPRAPRRLEGVHRAPPAAAAGGDLERLDDDPPPRRRARRGHEGKLALGQRAVEDAPADVALPAPGERRGEAVGIAERAVACGRLAERARLVARPRGGRRGAARRHAIEAGSRIGVRPRRQAVGVGDDEDAVGGDRRGRGPVGGIAAAPGHRAGDAVQRDDARARRDEDRVAADADRAARTLDRRLPPHRSGRQRAGRHAALLARIGAVAGERRPGPEVRTRRAEVRQCGQRPSELGPVRDVEHLQSLRDVQRAVQCAGENDPPGMDRHGGEVKAARVTRHRAPQDVPVGAVQRRRPAPVVDDDSVARDGGRDELLSAGGTLARPQDVPIVEPARDELRRGADGQQQVAVDDRGPDGQPFLAAVEAQPARHAARRVDRLKDAFLRDDDGLLARRDARVAGRQQALPEHAAGGEVERAQANGEPERLLVEREDAAAGDDGPRDVVRQPGHEIARPPLRQRRLRPPVDLVAVALRRDVGVARGRRRHRRGRRRERAAQQRQQPAHAQSPAHALVSADAAPG